MKITTLPSFVTFATQILGVVASGSVCSSGIYAALAPLDNYAPAVSYCQGQADKVTVTVTANAAKLRRRTPKTTTTTTTTTKPAKGSTTTKATTATTAKTTSKTTTSSTNAKASAWSSLIQQAQSVVATFCSCAGYPATSTVRYDFTSWYYQMLMTDNLDYGDASADLYCRG